MGRVSKADALTHAIDRRLHDLEWQVCQIECSRAPLVREAFEGVEAALLEANDESHSVLNTGNASVRFAAERFQDVDWRHVPRD